MAFRHRATRAAGGAGSVPGHREGENGLWTVPTAERTTPDPPPILLYKLDPTLRPSCWQDPSAGAASVLAGGPWVEGACRHVCGGKP